MTRKRLDNSWREIKQKMEEGKCGEGKKKEKKEKARNIKRICERQKRKMEERMRREKNL